MGREFKPTKHLRPNGPGLWIFCSQRERLRRVWHNDFINAGSGDRLSQTFSDTASHTLKISYWIDSDGQTPNFLEADYNATPLDSHTNFGTTGYTEYSFTVIGTGSDTLTFRAYDNPSYIALDDVSVTDITVPAVPESSTWAMMLMGFAGLGYMGIQSRRRMIAA